MFLRIKIEKAAMFWVNVLKNPLHFGTPDLIIAQKPKTNLYVNKVLDLPNNLSEYLSEIIQDFKCNKMEMAAAIIEFYAFRGVNLNEAMEIVYYANQIKEIHNSLNLNREHIITSVIYYHSKQNLSASDWNNLYNLTQFKRGIKRKYTKNENFINNK